MSITQLNPYLVFNGNAQKAIQFYEQALGAKVESTMHWGDMPGADCGPVDKERIMHSQLRIGAGVLMLSDAPPDRVLERGCFNVALAFDDPADLQKKFDALSAGGTVVMAVHDSFWGAKFGMLTDQFGVDWMFNCELKKG